MLLGPLLFAIMINDLTTPCLTIKYVDDTTIIHTDNDCNLSKLQDAFNTALSWSNDNNMKLNPIKTKLLCINNNRNKQVLEGIVTADNYNIEFC